MTGSAHGAPTRAPLYRDALALCEWTLARLSKIDEPLPHTLCRRVIDLHEAVLMALKGRHRDAHIERADDVLMLVRAELRIAAMLGYLEDRQMRHALERAGAIGRQLGGWRRALGPL
ncbi:four helix bundle protein [Haliangium sp.]|uniref:four helix bundle protein n=1 Tax=Haliangium sp. TaxID=2663208 RepID=UPI003D0EDCF8